MVTETATLPRSIARPSVCLLCAFNQTTEYLDIQMRLDQLGELKWSFRNLQIQGNFDQLLQSIENGTAYPGTDGAYKDGHGTAAFRIQNDQGDKITGCKITPGLQVF
jgi:hypothetical protein